MALIKWNPNRELLRVERDLNNLVQTVLESIWCEQIFR
jgi:hypothetical protein